MLGRSIVEGVCVKCTGTCVDEPIGLEMFGRGIVESDSVKFTGKIVDVPRCPEGLGRVVNALGTPWKEWGH